MYVEWAARFLYGDGMGTYYMPHAMNCNGLQNLAQKNTVYNEKRTKNGRVDSYRRFWFQTCKAFTSPLHMSTTRGDKTYLSTSCW